MALEEEMLERVRSLVWTGMYAPGEIEEMVCEEAEADDLEADGDEVRAAVAREWAVKAAEERAWPPETDCDRLDAVFEALSAEGVLALHNAGYTQSDGLSDVTEAYHERGGTRSGITGYCFYHGQDLERAVAGQGLDLTFGDVDGTDAAGIEVGRRIAAALGRAGFTVDWNGSIGTRIRFGLVWRKRYGGEG